MRKGYSGVLFAAVLMLVVASSLAAQSRLTANIPFGFSVTNKTLPAGSYTITVSSGGSILSLTSGSDLKSTIVLLSCTGYDRDLQGAQSQLVFHRYGNEYFLSRIEDGPRGTTSQLPPTRDEKERARTASVEKVQVLALLARR